MATKVDPYDYTQVPGTCFNCGAGFEWHKYRATEVDRADDNIVSLVHCNACDNADWKLKWSGGVEMGLQGLEAVIKSRQSQTASEPTEPTTEPT